MFLDPMYFNAILPRAVQDYDPVRETGYAYVGTYNLQPSVRITVGTQVCCATACIALCYIALPPSMRCFCAAAMLSPPACTTLFSLLPRTPHTLARRTRMARLLSMHSSWCASTGALPPAPRLQSSPPPHPQPPPPQPP